MTALMFFYTVYCKDNTVYFVLLYALQDDGDDLEPGGIDLFWYLNVKTFSNIRTVIGKQS